MKLSYARAPMNLNQTAISVDSATLRAINAAVERIR